MQSELTLLQQIKSGKIWDFPGGIHPPERKELSNQTAIQTLNYQGKLYIPLSQHIGESGELIIQAGDYVKKGQALTQPSNSLSLPIHASTSGQVVEITDHVAAHPSGKTEPTLVLQPDGEDTWLELSPFPRWYELSHQELISHIQKMGISGMGGAGFPTYAKVSTDKDIELLIINAVECEPYITADDVLMREKAEQIAIGAEILQFLVQSKLCIIAIEDNKPEAIEAIQLACQHTANVEVRVVPTKYPSGGEKQLIQLITGQQVPTGKYPADIGVIMQNLGTAYAVQQAVVEGKPLVERVVTVTGETISKPGNYWVKLGTPVEALLTETELNAEKKQRVIMGGPMMGFAIPNSAMPIIKTTNCILAPSKKQLPPRGVEQACIRCGMCADACPAELLPQQLQWFAKAKEHEKLEEYNLFDCIECGACAYVCPSQIPLVQYYRTSKAEIREADEEKRKADKAKIRFEQRQERLEREKQERLQRHKEAAEKRKKAMANDTGAKDKIAAALARAKAKKQVQASEPIEDKTQNTEQATTVAAPKDKVAAAIARAKAKKAAQSAVITQEVKQVDAEQNASGQPSNSESSTSNTDAAADEQKDKVAAAIARAKAKKAAKSTQNTATTSTQEVTESKTNTEAEQAETPIPEDARKAKVAAAIAKAKAKKLATEAAVQTEPEAAKTEPTLESEISNEPAPNALSPEEERKAKVAAAIAKAKAKKLAAQAKAQEEGNQS